MAQLIDLGKLRFYWAGDYNSATVYEVNDVVKYGGNVYVYTNTLSVAGNLPTDTDYWALMISGLKFEGEYNNATSYQVGDGVAYGGIVYICVADSTGNLPPNATYWSQFADGIQYEGSYAGGTAYQLNDVVTYGGKSYIATQLTSGNVPTNATYWDVLTEGVRGLGVYASGTTYLPGDIVSYGGNVYINTTTSTGVIPTNTANWNLMASGIKYIGAYNSGTAYKINEIVTYGAKLYVAKGATTGNLPTDPTYWDQLVDGISAEGVYNNATAYVPGDVVAYGANLYIAKDETTGNIPTNATYWDLFVDSITSAGAYSAGTTYYIGDVVRYGAYLYICKLESTGNAPTNTTYFDLFVSSIASLGVYASGTTYKLGDIVSYGANLYINKLESTGNIPTNTTYWDLFTSSVQSEGAWDSGTTYYTNDIVTYGPNTYIALRETVNDAPDVSTSDWEVFAEGINLRGNWAASTLYYINDIVVRGGSTYICILKHSSSGAFATDLAASKWTKFNGGIRWRGEWTTSTAYLVDDVVYAGVSTYIATADFTSDATSFENDTNWDILALGADYLPSQLGNAGKFLSTNGSNAVWASSGSLDSLTVNDGLEVNGDTVSHGDLNVTTRVVNVVNRIKTNNVATLTTDEEHFFDTGDTVVVVGIDTYPADTFDGTFTITATPTATTFSYAKSGANVGSTVTTGTTATVTGKIAVQGTSSFTGAINAASTLDVSGTLYVGPDAIEFETDAALTNAAAVFQINGDPASYAQISFRNEETTSSTDFIAYANNGDDSAGWIDVGITGSEFEQAEFGVTSKNDGYIFMQAPALLERTVSNKALTNNVATLTTSENHGFTTGYQVTVANVDATFNGTYTITSATNTEFSYAKTAANVASGVATGTATSATGDGNLVIATGGNGDKNKIVFGAGGFDSGVTQMEITPDEGVYVAINSVSTSSTTGALTVAGGVGVAGDLHVGSDLHATGSVHFETAEAQIYIGPDAVAFANTLTNPVLVATANVADYTQIAFKNFSNSANSSSDFLAYASNGDDNTGWIDMGITSESFNDPDFTITGANDGYIFMSAPSGTTGKGNLVLATDDTGTENKIVFAAGGLASDNEQMSITPDQNVHIEIATESTSPTTGALTVVGGVGIAGNLNVQGNVDIEGTIVFGGGGTTVETSNLAVTDPFIFVGSGNTSDIVDLGLITEHTVTVSPIAANVTNKQLTNNVATFTTSAPHTYRVGDVVLVIGIDATFDGTYPITSVPSSTTFTYAKTAANVASTAVSPAVELHVEKRRVFDGIARDATDNVTKFFQNAVTKPTTTVDFTEAGLTYADLKIKGLDAGGNLTVGTDKLAVNVAANTVTTSAAVAVNAQGTLTVGGASTLTGAVNAQSTLTVANTATFNGTSSFTNAATFSGGMVITGGVDIQELREYVVDETIGDITANVLTADYTAGNIYYVNTAPSANFTLNLLNVPTDNGYSVSVSVVVTQGATGYIPSAVQVAGVAQTLRWTTGAAPTPTSTANKLDVFSFTLIRRGGAWIVLGSAVLNF